MTAGPARDATPAPPGIAHGTPLVGREREQTALRDALAAALAGRGSLVLIGGEAGIGKTALAEALLAEAGQRGMRVLVGRCYDLMETPPYGPWAEALATAPCPDGLPMPPDLTGGSGAASQATLFAQVRDFLAALAKRQPLVLLLEDLHWADPASLDLLRVVARGLAALPLLLLATYRADEVADDHPLAARLPPLVREARATRLDLHPLDAAAIGALVATRYALTDADRERLVGYLAARTEGNALFLGELLRTLEGEALLRREGDRWAVGELDSAPVPALLRQVIAGRVARLDPETQRLLAVAAVVGQEVPLALWAAVGEVAEDNLLGHAERALTARLLAEVPDGTAVRFAHALIREALYARTPPLRRRAWHRATAEALLAAPDPDPDAVAHHLQRAGDARAEAWLVRAGERAWRAYAWLTAAARYEAALALLARRGGDAGERTRLLLRLGHLRRYAEPQASVAHADEALRLAEAAGDRALAAAALADRGLFRVLALDLGRGLADLAASAAAQEALAAAAGGAPGAPAPVRGTLILNLANAGRLAEAAAMGAAYLARATGPVPWVETGVSPRGNAWLGLGMSEALRGRPAAAGAALARARADYRAAGHHTMLGAGTATELELVALAYWPDRVAARRALAAEAEAAVARAGTVGYEVPSGLASLSLLALEGRWPEVPLDRAAALPFGVGQAARRALGPLARARGAADLAWEVVRALLPAGPGAEPGEGDYLGGVAAQRLAAALATDAGDLAEARAWLEAHDRWLAWSGAVLGRAEGALGWAAYHRAADDLAAARERAEAALALASEPRQPLALLTAHRTLGELDTAGGRHADAALHLDRALALVDACAAPYERALTLLALAELRAAIGDREQVGVVLAEARTVFTDLGAAPALARADALAARLASPPAPPVPAALPFGLTAREVEVLRLVAQGLTNAQAAERLFLSPKTVSRHLDNIYAKLGVSSRAAAARLATERGLA